MVTTGNQQRGGREAGEWQGDGDGGRNLNQKFYFFVTSMLRLAAMLVST